MALIRPTLNLQTHTMSVSSPASPSHLEIPLEMDIISAVNQGSLTIRENARLCEDTIRSLVFSSPQIHDFFSAIVGTECTLAMYHPETNGSLRYFKPHLPAVKSSVTITDTCAGKREIWLSNESPFLLVSQSSVDALSSATTRKISPAVFRPNFVLVGNYAYAEDSFRRIRIGDVEFDILGQCRRCHMVCVDPELGVKEKNGGDVYLGLGKTRKKDTGGVVFGIHMGLADVTEGSVRVGDSVVVEKII